MSRSPNRFWVLIALLLSGQAFALGLGEIRLDSALNEPLRAQIPLVSATPEELDNLTVRLAPAELFDRYGLDRPGFLLSVSFRVVRGSGSGDSYIVVNSTQPITEPFLTFLVEASWQRGRLLREYTVLLDPPTFAPQPAAPAQEPVRPPVSNQAADSGQIQRPAPASPTPAPAPAPAPVVVAPAETSRPAAEEPETVVEPEAAPEADNLGQEQDAIEDFNAVPVGDYEVLRGDTLWRIASRYRPDNRLTINQTMLAIFEANPEAFAGNINSMSAGASLRIPSADDVFRINRADALAEVERQISNWEGGASSGFDTGSDSAPLTAAQPSLELVPPDEDSLSGDSSAVDAVPEVIEPEIELDPDAQRIVEIEGLLSDQQDGLVEIADNELAALQRELAELRGEELPPEPAAIDPEPEAPVEDDVFVSEEPDMGTDTDAADADTVDASPEIESPTPQPEVAPAPAPAPEESIVDKVVSYATGLWGMVGLAVALVIAGLLFFMRRASGSSDEEGAPAANDATGMWSALDDGDFADQTIAQEMPAEQTSQLAAMNRAGETTIVVEESGSPGTDGTGEFPPTMEIPAAPEGPEANDAQFTEETAENPALEDTFSSETALNLDQSDPIAEADFHMAYGLYDQAADLIIGALEVAPERTDYIAKLCEIYFVWGNRDAFVDAAERFKSVLGDGEDPEWDKTVIMGQQIAGDHPLFGDAPAATKAVDLAFDDDDGADAALDMDLDAGAEDGGDFIDLGEAAPVSATEPETSTAIDFAFDDDDDDATGAAEALPAADALDMDFGDEDLNTAEMPAVEDLTAEMPTAEMPTVGEATAEMPTAEMPLAEMPTAEMPTIEEATAEMPAMSDATAEMPSIDAGSEDDDSAVVDLMDSDATGAMPAISPDDATALASMDDLPSADATSEIDLDDLGLDLDALDDDLESSVGDDLDDLEDAASAMEFDNAALAETGRNEALQLPDDDDTASNLLDATGQTQVLPGDLAVETGTGTNIEKALSGEDIPISGDAETMLASLDDDDDIELDLDDLTAALEVSTGDDGTLEQPLDDSVTAEAPLDGDDLSDAKTMTEVGTKLDLARAYVDMGDPAGAKSILEEVLDEGDDAQRQQAQQLLDSLPA